MEEEKGIKKRGIGIVGHVGVGKTTLSAIELSEHHARVKLEGGVIPALENPLVEELPNEQKEEPKYSYEQIMAMRRYQLWKLQGLDKLRGIQNLETPKGCIKTIFSLTYHKLGKSYTIQCEAIHSNVGGFQKKYRTIERMVSDYVQYSSHDTIVSDGYFSTIIDLDE